MIFNQGLNELKNALLDSTAWNEAFVDSTSTPEDHIFLYQLDPDLLDDMLPVCLITQGPAWNRTVQSFGGYFTTESDIILHFEMKYDDAEYTDNEILEEFTDFVGYVMLDLEKLVDCHLIMDYAPESNATPSISPLDDPESYVRFRIQIKGR